MKRLLIFVVMLVPISVGAQGDRETRLIDNLQKYYRLVGMEERATWLANERAQRRIVFGEIPAAEADTHAFVHMRTGVMTINRDLLDDNTFRGLVDLGSALAHERVHQNQSYLGWAAETYKQDLGGGNAYERAGWAESLRVARQAAISLKTRLSQAKSARERERVGKLLQHAVGSWQNLLTDWRRASRTYGQFGPREFIDRDGLPFTVEDMAQECESLVNIALDATVTARAMNRSYTGKYRGEFVGGATGKVAFDVRADQSIVGLIKGKYKSSDFEGQIVEGRVDEDGLITGQVEGILKVHEGFKFTGSLSGRMTSSGAEGKFSAGSGDFWPSGSWKVER